MKIAFVDTYYPDVLVGRDKVSYASRMADLMRLHFGTAYYYSDAFKKMGWTAIDIIGNDTDGRKLWCAEAGLTYENDQASVIDQLVIFEPDIVYMQDLGFFEPTQIAGLKKRLYWKFVSQHSCPWAGDNRIKAFDAVFSSFPHYLPRISALGVQTSMLPIAFGHRVLEHIKPQRRDLPVTFVGGLNGTSGHWAQGTVMMEHVAAEVPAFKWWGYFIGEPRNYPALQRTYQGPAWGMKMYNVYARSQMVINRHGEVAEGYSNNMRMFEATGCGALLLTEQSKNLHDYFAPGMECVAYREPAELVDIINKQLLWQPELVADIAKRGQALTLENHTYEKRLAQIEPFLQKIAAGK
jgi:hypothetical protein